MIRVQSIPDLNMDLETTEVTTKRIGNTNWCQCGLCQSMETKLTAYVAWTQIKFLMIILKVIISFTTGSH